MSTSLSVINDCTLDFLQLAYYTVQALRVAFDIISMYKIGKMTENKWLTYVLIYLIFYIVIESYTILYYYYFILAYTPEVDSAFLAIHRFSKKLILHGNEA